MGIIWSKDFPAFFNLGPRAIDLGIIAFSDEIHAYLQSLENWIGRNKHGSCLKSRKSEIQSVFFIVFVELKKGDLPQV